MNSDELTEWLKGDASISSGWTKDGTGETVGHQRYNGIPRLCPRHRCKHRLTDFVVAAISSISSKVIPVKLQISIEMRT